MKKIIYGFVLGASLGYGIQFANAFTFSQDESITSSLREIAGALREIARKIK